MDPFQYIQPVMPPRTMNVAMHKSFERLKRFIGWDALGGFCGGIKMQSGMYLAQGLSVLPTKVLYNRA